MLTYALMPSWFFFLRGLSGDTPDWFVSCISDDLFCGLLRHHRRECDLRWLQYGLLYAEAGFLYCFIAVVIEAIMGFIVYSLLHINLSFVCEASLAL